MTAISNLSFRYEFQRAFDHIDLIRKLKYRFFTLSFFILFLGCSSDAQKAGEWHSFHGFDRTNKSTETGLLITWPENGPTLIWTASGLGEGYSSVSIADGFIYTQGQTQVKNYGYYGVDTQTGKLLWYVNWKNRNGLYIPDVIVHDNYVFIFSGYGMGSMLVKLTLAGEEIIPEKVWQTELMDNQHGGVIFHNGYLYGSGSNARGWYCSIL